MKSNDGYFGYIVSLFFAAAEISCSRIAFVFSIAAIVLIKTEEVVRWILAECSKKLGYLTPLEREFTTNKPVLNNPSPVESTPGSPEASVDALTPGGMV